MIAFIDTFLRCVPVLDVKLSYYEEGAKNTLK